MTSEKSRETATKSEEQMLYVRDGVQILESAANPMPSFEYETYLADRKTAVKIKRQVQHYAHDQRALIHPERQPSDLATIARIRGSDVALAGFMIVKCGHPDFFRQSGHVWF
ncbi:hypothetical protein [Burkholderia lata]|uniref:hypothetical protein n=1 Tax=Burkholderia lata (strain ATCC 17760 / DSM 23089 / LMG 22485 / NCIMB 9086 / R18194 / 383) TaxID=482957 RepID=UPI0015821F70|nr:hypothetical protein [Burkholderia lata]